MGRLNKSRYIRRANDKRLYYSRESFDAILWDIQPENNICRVKIQGSNTLITALYPENWEQTPSWLKPGNSVRIAHTGGDRGNVEVIGHGQYVPTPVSGAAAPTPSTPADNRISGAIVQPYADPIYAVFITTGSVMIGGTIVPLNASSLTMGDDSDILGSMGTGLFMGTSSYAASIIPTAAPGAAYRIDLIVVGLDGVVDLVTGTPHATSPVEPATPSSHFKLAQILILPSMTEITTIDINRDFVTPVPTFLEFDISDTSLGWAEVSTEVDLLIKNQYGVLMANGASSWQVSLELLRGDGTIKTGGASSESYLVGTSGAGSTKVDFSYERVFQAGKTASLEATLLNYSVVSLSSIAMIFVEDEYGDPLY